jgi:hypothetical protein
VTCHPYPLDHPPCPPASDHPATHPPSWFSFSQFLNFSIPQFLTFLNLKVATLVGAVVQRGHVPRDHRWVLADNLKVFVILPPQRRRGIDAQEQACTSTRGCGKERTCEWPLFRPCSGNLLPRTRNHTNFRCSYVFCSRVPGLPGCLLHPRRALPSSTEHCSRSAASILFPRIAPLQHTSPSPASCSHLLMSPHPNPLHRRDLALLALLGGS